MVQVSIKYKNGVWIATGKGPMRPFIIETENIYETIDAAKDIIFSQGQLIPAQQYNIDCTHEGRYTTAVGRELQDPQQTLHAHSLDESSVE